MSVKKMFYSYKNPVKLFWTTKGISFYFFFLFLFCIL